MAPNHVEKQSRAPIRAGMQECPRLIDVEALVEVVNNDDKVIEEIVAQQAINPTPFRERYGSIDWQYVNRSRGEIKPIQAQSNRVSDSSGDRAFSRSTRLKAAIAGDIQHYRQLGIYHGGNRAGI